MEAAEGLPNDNPGSEQIDVLTRENATLHEGLGEPRSNASPRTGIGRNKARGTHDHTTCVAWDDYWRLTEKYNQLLQLHRELERSHAECKPHIARANAKYEVAKNNAKQWKLYIKHKQEEQTTSLSTDRSSSPRKGNVEIKQEHRDADRTPRARTNLVTEQLSSNDQRTPSALLPHSKQAQVPDGSGILKTGPAESKASHDDNERVPSSQTTDGGAPSSPPTKRARVSEDEPEFVVARPVKRQSRGKASTPAERSPRIKQEPATQAKPIELASDDSSSPKRACQPPLRVEASDLDSVIVPLNTPSRKTGRRVSDQLQRPAPPTRETSSLSEGNLPDDILANDKTASESTNMMNHNATVSAPRLESAAGTSAGKEHDRALSQMSPNIVTPKREQPTSSTKRKRKRDSNKAVAILAEDGDEQSSQVNQLPSSKTPQHIARGQRLKNLLGCPPTQAEAPLPLRRTPVSEQRSKAGPTSAQSGSFERPAEKRASLTGQRQPDIARRQGDLRIHEEEGIMRDRYHGSAKRPSNEHSVESSKHLLQRPTHKSPLSKASRRSPPNRLTDPGYSSGQKATPTRVAAARAGARPQPSSPPPPPPNPEEEPIRNRPLHILQLNDFAINPAYLDNAFAFSDTIRDRTTRRCLPGCTRPSCCGGTFLAAAAAHALPPSRKTDIEALEDYLGTSYAQIMGAYGPDKRADLLMQAQAFVFANQHGKHREAFERRATPPGFWRTDMPSTQEAEEDRRKAAVLEREKVEERWREALRSGGRWVFRDER